MCSKHPASQSPLGPTPNSHTLISLNFQFLNLLLLSMGSLQISLKLRPSSNVLSSSLRHHFFLFPLINKCFKNLGVYSLSSHSPFLFSSPSLSLASFPCVVLKLVCRGPQWSPKHQIQEHSLGALQFVSSHLNNEPDPSQRLTTTVGLKLCASSPLFLLL